jgi:hypothetical protein
LLDPPRYVHMAVVVYNVRPCSTISPTYLLYWCSSTFLHCPRCFAGKRRFVAQISLITLSDFLSYPNFTTALYLLICKCRIDNVVAPLERVRESTCSNQESPPDWRAVWLFSAGASSGFPIQQFSRKDVVSTIMDYKTTTSSAWPPERWQRTSRAPPEVKYLIQLTWVHSH